MKILELEQTFSLSMSFLSCTKVVIKDSKGDAFISNLTVKGNIAVFSVPCLPDELKQKLSHQFLQWARKAVSHDLSELGFIK